LAGCVEMVSKPPSHTKKSPDCNYEVGDGCIPCNCSPHSKFLDGDIPPDPFDGLFTV